MELKNMLDKPMVEPVAYLNLLGCRTLWSCCGYHYKGETEGKSHMLGNTQILMVADAHSFEVVIRLFNENPQMAVFPKWSALLDVKPLQGSILNLRFAFRVSDADNWWNPKSAHFHEGPVLAIDALVRGLRSMESDMKDEIILVDQNAIMKAHTQGLWDFEPGEAWTIRKSDYFSTEKKVKMVAGINYAPVAQQIERFVSTELVGGAIPSRRANHFQERKI